MDGPFPEGKYKCFFTLLKAVFETFNDRKGELGKVGVAHWSHDLPHDLSLFFAVIERHFTVDGEL